MSHNPFELRQPFKETPSEKELEEGRKRVEERRAQNEILAEQNLRFEQLETDEILREKAEAAAAYWARRLYVAGPGLPNDLPENLVTATVQRNIQSTSELYPIEVEKVKAFELNLTQSIHEVLTSELRADLESRSGVAGKGLCEVGFKDYQPDSLLQGAADKSDIDSPLRLYLPMDEYVVIEPGRVIVMKGPELVTTLYETKDTAV